MLLGTFQKVREGSTGVWNLPKVVLNCRTPLEPFWKCQSSLNNTANLFEKLPDASKAILKVP